MSCNCTIYECLPIAPNILQCGEYIATTLLADETGIWTMRYEFNGRWFGEQITVTNDELISIPYVFNESYTHIIEFIKGDGTVFENTCYTLDTNQIMGISPASSGGGGISVDNWLTVTVQQDGSTFEVAAGYTIWLVFNGQQGLLRGVAFTQSGTTITMINGDYYAAGTQLLLLSL